MESQALISQVVGVVSRIALVGALVVVFAPVAEAHGDGGSNTTNPTMCNQEVSGIVVLKQDLACSDSDGLIVVEDHTKIFLNGYSIRCTDLDVAAYKFSCQGGDPNNPDTGGAPSLTDPDMGPEDSDFGIDTAGHSHVEIIGPGLIQGFDVGVYAFGGPNAWGGSASNVKVKKLNITGPDGRADIMMPGLFPRPRSWGILVQNYVEHGRCNNDSYHYNCKCKDDDHGHGVEVSGNAVDNHVEGIALYNSSRVDVRTNFVHDVNDADDSRLSLLQSHGILVCADTTPSGNASFCTPGISRRNRIRFNLVVDNGQNYPDTSAEPQPDSGITLTGNVVNTDVSQNTVMGNNGDGISVRDKATYNTIQSNLAVYNSSTDSFDVDPITGLPVPGTQLFFDITRRRAPGNTIKTNNKCLTENGEVDSTVCNPGENDDWQ